VHTAASSGDVAAAAAAAAAHLTTNSRGPASAWLSPCCSSGTWPVEKMLRTRR
jgi:hypothetical protein